MLSILKDREGDGFILQIHNKGRMTKEGLQYMKIKKLGQNGRDSDKNGDRGGSVNRWIQDGGIRGTL